MRPRSLTIAFVLAAAAALPGCGGGQDGDVEQITDLTKQFAADTREKDWKGACEAMSADAKAEVMAGADTVGGHDCATVMGRLYALDASPETLEGDVKVSNVKVDGDRATADVRPTFAGQEPTLNYVREDGRWKLESDAAAAAAAG